MGLPKTVDNDLTVTDHCPGYGSVARWLAVSVRDAGLDTEAIYTSDTIKIVETMGRNAGWITAATALARQGEKRRPPHHPPARDPLQPGKVSRRRRAGLPETGLCPDHLL